ncbi:c-type cytochrome [Luteolibacter sp. SL250]|uniref:cbb3-type cytochrome c oxidase N-terminal domain-containing protein n=1 Tax=Luteolibacter sp. SL250 TaxID=2995170 RepID=UPI00226EC06B|nr:cbb3-type cytochrome c oxidase N-terminal domain-containing protein [Luteolibacter sp. SL250]WAC21406.1 c-type cytochrome [Luteolibacter sp. SL250]
MDQKKQPEITHAEYASKKGEIALRPHEFDGIQEYDQTLPNWWLFIFHASVIAFVGGWFLYYNVGLTKTDAENVDAQLERIASAKAKALEDMLSTLNDETLVNQWATDTTVVDAGRQIYQANCIACHGENLTASIDVGGGQKVNLPGLSLKDAEWKYGAKPMDIFRIINEGTPADSPGHNGAKMQAWGQTLPPLQVAQITAFLIHENEAEFR